MKTVHCNLCGSTRFFWVHHANHASTDSSLTSNYRISESHLEKPSKIVRCMTCSLVYVPQDGSFADPAKDYEEGVDPNYVEESKGRLLQARIILDQIKRFKKRGKLLDVGAGPGFFLDEARRSGFEVRGIDLSRWSATYAREHFGIDIFQGQLEAAKFPDRHFDVIVMNDFIEHVSDPSLILKEARRILKNDGILYISTPDISSFFSRILQGRWWGINKYHLTYFSRRTLNMLLDKIGFHSVRFYPYPRVFSVKYWSQRLKPYPRWVRAPFDLVSSLDVFKNSLFKLDTHDQLGVIAKKIQKLDLIFETDDTPAESKPKKVIAVLPAFNAEKTLERTVQDIPKDFVDEIILVDDKSRDQTVQIARRLGLTVIQHAENKGYGGNQKTCYRKALEMGADIVVMVHPDYQYDPKIIPQLIAPIRRGEADAVFGSRMMKGGALLGGMPLWKHNANILLTAFENVMLGTYLSEYHSGFRAYSATLLKTVRFEENSDNFIFDTQIIVQAVANHFKIEEIPIRTRYFSEASSIRLGPSIRYGFGIIGTMLRYSLHANGIFKDKRLTPKH